MTTLSRIALLGLLLVSAPAHGGEIEILTTFPGASGPGPKDCPDNAGAGGPDHVVVVDSVRTAEQAETFSSRHRRCA